MSDAHQLRQNINYPSSPMTQSKPKLQAEGKKRKVRKMSAGKSPDNGRENMVKDEDSDGVIPRLTSESEETRNDALEDLRVYLQNGQKVSLPWLDELVETLSTEKEYVEGVTGAVYYVSHFQTYRIERVHIRDIVRAFREREAKQDKGEIPDGNGNLLMALDEIAEEYSVQYVEEAMPEISRYLISDMDVWRTAARNLVSESKTYSL